ncbi:MAG TPA: methyltransferase domain-containing protein [Desulfobacterales bacterium]|jgi:2-polyprenyl-3-methyl-5-hydroxy-6-metoxy-1,4-benzoquinol methylase|nr:methyltransferase domain-containing protein [Desulfobacterales bacterium]
MNICLICQANLQLLRNVYNYRLVECTNCGVIQLVDSEVNQVEFIRNTRLRNDQWRNENPQMGCDYYSFPEYMEKYQPIFHHFFNQRLQRLRSYGMQTDGGILDAGCGFGFFVKHCIDSGIRAAGIDIEPNCVEYAKNHLKLINIHHGTIEDFNQNGQKYNAIVSCDVLEHCLDPMAFMEACKKLLLPKGLLYVQVPNVIGIRVPYGYSLGLPYHIWHYNPKSLKYLFRVNGFKILNYWTGTSGVISQREKKQGNFLFRLKTTIASIFKIGVRLQMMGRYQE